MHSQTAAAVTSGKVLRQKIPVLSALGVGPLFLRPPLRTSPGNGVGRWGVKIHATPSSAA